MASGKISLLTFNRGIISKLGMARIDLKRVALSAETMTNWMPRVLGSMSIRPGLEYLGATLSNAAARLLSFQFSTTDNALLELTSAFMRVWIDDELITRPAVASAVTNGNFTSNITGWTDNDEAGCTSDWATGYMQFVADGTAAAIRDQIVSVSGADLGVEHALRVVIARGPVTFMVGTAAADDSYVATTVLQTGTHSLAFTPTGNFNIRFMSRQVPYVWVDSCTVEAAGVMSLPTPWLAADLNSVNIDQSGDVVFVACAGYQQRRIERRSARSWSVALYVTNDGPFRIRNVTNTTISSSGLTGNVILLSSTPIFKSGHVGALFRLVSNGQSVIKNISAQNTFLDPIRVTGVGTDRAFTIEASNSFVATVTLQRSLESDSGPWSDVPTKSWTTVFTDIFTDGLDNQEAWYRLGVKTGDYTSGTVMGSLTIHTGSITGVARIIGFTNASNVTAEVVTALGDNFGSTDDWSEGSWSTYRGWPTSVALHEGRLWWSGKGKVWGSISDVYDGFDPDFVGDAGTIERSIGSGPVDNIKWMMSIERLTLGTDAQEIQARSSQLDEPLTPTNFNLRSATGNGSNAVRPAKIDQRCIFANRSGTKVFDIGFSKSASDFASSDLTALVPELGQSGIVRMDVQRLPDVRIHCVRSDGVAMVAVADKNEEVLAWVTVETDGIIEDVVVLPAVSGDLDDQVYYVVKRTINGATVRYLEKWAQELECRGTSGVCKLADSFVERTSIGSGVITNLSHLEGESVVVWGDGVDLGTDDDTSTWTQRYTVSSGRITLASEPDSTVIVGLGYTAQFKSTKLGLATQDVQTPLNAEKRINHLGFIMAYVHSKGVRYGPDFTNLDDLPSTVNGVDLGQVILTDYDESPSSFGGSWSTDSRLCMQAQAPRPCTILAATIDIEMHK